MSRPAAGRESSDVTVAGRSYTTQWSKIPGTSVSSMSSANAAVREGVPAHLSGGCRLAPAHVNWVGIVAPSANASLVSCIAAAALARALAVAPDVVVAPAVTV